MTPPANTERYQNHRFPAEIISHGVWLYYRFNLSYRDVQVRADKMSSPQGATMKRFIGYAVILVVAILLIISSDLLFAESKNLKIATILWRGETEGEKGFKDGLKELGYEVQYTVWNASQDKKELARILRKELKPHRSPPAQEALQQNLQNLRDKSVEVDVVYLPSDSFVVSNAELIGTQLRAAKIKSVGSIKEYADQGALMAFAANFYELGKAAAKVLDRHQKGEPLQNIPVQITQKPLVVINKTTSTILDVHFPEDILKTAILVE